MHVQLSTTASASFVLVRPILAFSSCRTVPSAVEGTPKNVCILPSIGGPDPIAVGEAVFRLLISKVRESKNDN
jgi:hypothetical protein